MPQLIKFKAIPCRSQVPAFLRTLDANEAHDLYGQIEAQWYWQKRNPYWFTDSRKSRALVKFCHRLVKKRLRTGNVSPELSVNGSILQRSTVSLEPDSYFKTFLGGGWYYLDGNDGYNLYWANDEKRLLCNYCEGSVTRYKCPNQTVFDKEVNDVHQWLAENG